MKNKVLKTILSLAMAVSLATTSVVPVSAASLSPDASAERERVSAQVAQAAAEEGMVLLDNQGALPIAKSGRIALYGAGVYATVKGGTGSGDVNLKTGKTWDVLSAFDKAGYTVVNRSFLQAMAREWGGNTGSIWGAPPTFDEGDYAESDVDAAAAQTDTAIYVITRNSGEFADRTRNPGDYYLYESEAANLALLGSKFENVIVVLNTGGILDTNFYHGKNESITPGDPQYMQKIDGLDALVLMSQAGQEGGNALVRILNGDVNPSGKLTDTWAIDYADYPSSAEFSNNDGETWEERYTDDIYVGYRYFDTFGIDVAYPFGYGSSYTDFEIKVTSVTANTEKVTVQAAVTNTGSVDGKEVVEVYFSAPAGSMDKPYQELAGYQKVAVAAGETENVTVTFDTKDMSSYDESKEAYIMEDGTYTIRVGNSSRNTVVASTITLDADVVTEEAKIQLGATRDQLMNGTYEEGVVLNNDYSGRNPVPQFGNTPIEGILNGRSSGYGTGITPSTTGLTASASTTALSAADFPEPETHTYQNGDITTYVSSSSAKDSAVYAKNKRTPEDMSVKGAENFETVTAVRNATLVDVALGNITMEQLVADMSNLELADLVEGGSYAGLTPDNSDVSAVVGSQADSVDGAAGETTSNLYLSRYIPNIVLSDGPAGIRITSVIEDYDRVTNNAVYDSRQVYYTRSGSSWTGYTYQPVSITGQEPLDTMLENGTQLYTYVATYYQNCTAFPIGTLLAMTWDPEVIESVGRAIGTEMLEYGVTSWLAPALNIHRNPLCGRNFEYFSEDPLVSGLSAAAETIGVQTDKEGNYTGIGVTLKHYAFNSQEANRNGTNSVMSERAAREIYLKGFEIAVKKAQPDYFMTAYNMINGYPTFHSYGLVTEILRNEWGFDGFVMTDWMSVNTVRGKNQTEGRNARALLMYAGNDCEMPGGNVPAMMTALESNDMRLGDLQRSAMNMLKVIMRSKVFNKLMDTLLEEYPDISEPSDAKNEIEDLKNQLAETIESAKQQVAEAVEEAEKQVAEVQKQLDAAKDEYEKLQNDSNATAAELEQVKNQVDSLNTQLEEAKKAQAQVEELKNQLDDAQKELTDSKAESAAALKAAQEQVTALQQNLDDVQKQLTNSAATNAAALKAAQDQVAALRQQLANAQQNVSTTQKVAIAANKKKYTVKKGKTVNIIAVASDGGKITYTSKNKKIAKVNKKGKITGVKKGSTKITLKSGTASLTVTVKVKK